MVKWDFPQNLGFNIHRRNPLFPGCLQNKRIPCKQKKPSRPWDSNHQWNNGCYTTTTIAYLRVLIINPWINHYFNGGFLAQGLLNLRLNQLPSDFQKDRYFILGALDSNGLLLEPWIRVLNLGVIFLGSSDVCFFLIYPPVSPLTKWGLSGK